MNSLSINLQGDGVWPELVDREVIHLRDVDIKVAVLPGGLASGRPSVSIRLDLPDGRVVVAETTARLFCTASRVILGRYPDLFSDDKPGRQ